MFMFSDIPTSAMTWKSTGSAICRRRWLLHRNARSAAPSFPWDISLSSRPSHVRSGIQIMAGQRYIGARGANIIAGMGVKRTLPRLSRRCAATSTAPQPRASQDGLLAACRYGYLGHCSIGSTRLAMCGSGRSHTWLKGHSEIDIQL